MDHDPIVMTAFELSQHKGEVIARSYRDERTITETLTRSDTGNGGWFLLNPVTFIAIWDGGTSLDALHIHYMQEHQRGMVSSNFGYGILTWNPLHIFRTEPGWNLHARGPVNHPKRGVLPLEGVVETDWAESTFTMNWQMTEPGYPVVFEAGEPFCFISPCRRGEIEHVVPSVTQLIGEPNVLAAYQRGLAETRNSAADPVQNRNEISESNLTENSIPESSSL